MKNKIYSGFLHTSGEGDHICLEGSPVSELILEDMKLHGDFLTVRYYICDKECSLEQAQKDWLKIVIGLGEAEFCEHYSDITGYLWTDEDLNVGGHDLINELSSFTEKYLIMSIDFEKGKK